MKTDALISRQLRRAFGNAPRDPATQRFIAMVAETYEGFVEELEVVERTLEISSEELIGRVAERKAILGTIPDTLIWVDDEDLVKEVLLSREADFSVSPPVVGQPLGDFQPMGEPTRVRECLELVRQGYDGLAIEYPTMICNEERHFEARFVTVDDETILVVLREITDRKALEAANTSITRTLERAKTELQRLIDIAPVGIVVSDGEGRLQRMNSCARKLLDYSEEEARAQARDALFSDDSREVARSALNEARAKARSEAPLGGSYEVEAEVTLRRSTGDSFPAELNTSCLCIDDDELFVEVLTDVSERKAREDSLRREAFTDPLTGASNRRHFFREGDYRIVESKRLKRVDSLLMMDVDHFKTINDRFGHAAGDQVLVELSELVRSHLRSSDLFGRLGGEEFAVLLSDCNRRLAEETAERLRREVSRTVVYLEERELQFTISVGVAQVLSSDADISQPLERADKALYLAKESGRNRIESFMPGRIANFVPH